MEFGFNYITEEARSLMDKHGIKFRQLSATTWKVYTENFDLQEEDFREREIDPDDPYREKMYFGQGVRVVKYSTRSGLHMYVYLIQDAVFYMYNHESKDYSTYPPTIFVDSVLDAIPGYNQDSWRDRLLSVKPMADPSQPLI